MSDTALAAEPTAKERQTYRANASNKMKRWSDAKLDKEAIFSRGDEAGWEGEEWRFALDDELKRRSP